MNDLIRKHALLNAIGHNGKADAQAVLGKVIAEKPELKDKIAQLVVEIKKIVGEINALGLDKQKKELEKLGPVKVMPKKKEEGLPSLPDAVKGKVVMRLAPYPSGPLHIGNARMVILNDEYAKIYKGKLLLVIDDTIGSEEKFIIPEAYQMIKDNLQWLCVKYHRMFLKSERLKLFYKFAEMLINKNIAYICECDGESLRRNRLTGVACSHRNIPVAENLKLWKAMLAGKYKEGTAVLRLKTDMQHPNPAFRDRVLMRIVERAHPLVGKKYKVWPMLEFSWAVDDYLLGMTHIIRGKDLVIEDMMENFIWEKMGWKKPEFIHYGFLQVGGVKLSKTEARKLIEKKIYSGWDDPRTWSMMSLERRGIQPAAIRKFIVNMGLSQADVSVPEEILYAENRKIIDAQANRYLAVIDPVEISVVKPPKIKKIEMNLHPDFPRRGRRKISVNLKKIYVEREDFERFYEKEVGLINLLAVRLKKEADFLSKGIGYDLPKIHWVSEPNVKIKIVMPDGKVWTALAEKEVKNLKKGSLVQFYRVGFCRVDKTGKETVLYFAHK